MAKKPDVRPVIATISVSAELRRWYWLKVELAAEARRLGIKCTGAKFTILERLCHFHDTGVQQWQGDDSPQVSSKFDWHSSELTNDTVITDNYKNSQNVRRFFKAQIDPGFKFNIGLLDWFKGNIGRTLGDACEYIQEQRVNPNKTKIKPHNQFNQYARDFADDNPLLGMKDARKVWALKKKLPSENGRHEYERSDLQLLFESELP